MKIIINCPYCGSNKTQKRGVRNGNQRMQCVICRDKGDGGWFSVNKAGEIINKIKDPDKEKKLIKLLKKDSYTIEYLSNASGLLPNEVRKKIKELEENKYNIEYANGRISLAKQIEVGNKQKLNIDYWRGERIKIGFCADSHLCSKYERLPELNLLYDVFVDEGIEIVYQGGNLIEGENQYNKYELTVLGVTSQVEYLIKNYPKRKGIITKFITADDHEGWYIKQIRLKIGEYIELMAKKIGRNDLEYIGHVECDIPFEGIKGQSWMRVIHPGGGSAYADSYKAQKMVEGLQGGEKPRIILVGHYHKLNYCFPREVHVIQMGCTKDQGIWGRKKFLRYDIGGGILEMILAPDGTINRIKVEFITFFNKKFYIGKDKYWR